MSEVEELIKAYDGQIRLPWKKDISGAEKVWCLVYNQANERRIRFRITDFETTTKKAGYKWVALDLTDEFAVWMSNHRYRESYFDSPELIDPALKEFTEIVVQKITSVLQGVEVDDHTVVAITGLASLFGLTRASTVLEKSTKTIRGRLLVFFPGSHEGSNYRLLDARDGWNYLAIPIKAQEGKE
jgi:hypothetical protein